jgi:hypothetical protein
MGDYRLSGDDEVEFLSRREMHKYACFVGVSSAVCEIKEARVQHLPRRACKESATRRRRGISY